MEKIIESNNIPKTSQKGKLSKKELKTCCLCGEPIPKGNITLARDTDGKLKPAHWDCIAKQQAVDYVLKGIKI